MQEIEWPRKPGESEIDQRVRMLLWSVRMLYQTGRPISHREVYQLQLPILGYDYRTVSNGLLEIRRRGFLWQQIRVQNGVIRVSAWGPPGGGRARIKA